MKIVSVCAVRRFQRERERKREEERGRGARGRRKEIAGDGRVGAGEGEGWKELLIRGCSRKGEQGEGWERGAADRIEG